MQKLVSIILNSDTQRPSSVKLWHTPHDPVLPGAPSIPRRRTPPDEHDTSYFADSANILSFSDKSVFISVSPFYRPPQITPSMQHHHKNTLFFNIKYNYFILT